MMMESNTALRDEFNEALASITEDEMNQLIQDYITAAINDGTVTPVTMPVIDGAETIKVAVTGSLPPMDYVAADGSPAGFNTALLAEISKRINKNIELVVVDSVGRAAALASGTVDAVFWTRTNRRANEVAEMSEEERSSLIDNEQLTDAERETLRQVRELFDFSAYGKADMPEGTIITTPYYSDLIVPVTTKTTLESIKKQAGN
jgi:ABC-type amino acid transport substrate-binding protein